MTVVAVNIDGTEIICNRPLHRISTYLKKHGNDTSDFVKRYYKEGTLGEWYTNLKFDCTHFPVFIQQFVVLPKGTIYRLIGENLTYTDNPIELKEYI